MNERDKPKRRWYQFRLRTLLLAILVLSLPLSWFAWRMKQARRQKEAVAAIYELGGYMVYEGGPRIEPPSSLLRTLLGNEFFDKVEEVHLDRSEVTDTELGCLCCLKDAKCLWLDSDNITDAGLEHLRGLTALEDLTIFSSQITDAGLEHLKRLNNLTDLCVKGSKVTPEGVKKLQEALPNCKIEY